MSAIPIPITETTITTRLEIHNAVWLVVARTERVMLITGDGTGHLTSYTLTAEDAFRLCQELSRTFPDRDEGPVLNLTMRISARLSGTFIEITLTGQHYHDLCNRRRIIIINDVDIQAQGLFAYPIMTPYDGAIYFAKLTDPT